MGVGRRAAISQSTPLRAVASLEAECASLALAASRLPSALEAAQQAGLEESAAKEAVEGLQRTISSSMMLSQAVEKSLSHVKKSGNASSRAGYLLTLFDQIGPPPACGRSWREEWCVDAGHRPARMCPHTTRSTSGCTANADGRGWVSRSLARREARVAEHSMIVRGDGSFR